MLCGFVLVQKVNGSKVNGKTSALIEVSRLFDTNTGCFYVNVFVLGISDGVVVVVL